jgi:hypothetical protein
MRDFACWTGHLVAGGLMVFHDSTDLSLGAFRVIEIALASGDYVRLGIVSRATILRKVAVADAADARQR